DRLAAAQVLWHLGETRIDQRSLDESHRFVETLPEQLVVDRATGIEPVGLDEAGGLLHGLQFELGNVEDRPALQNHPQQWPRKRKVLPGINHGAQDSIRTPFNTGLYAPPPRDKNRGLKEPMERWLSG